MRISAVTFPALLSAPIALFALAAVASHSGFLRSEEPEFPTLAVEAGAERIPLRAGGGRGGDERTFSRLPPGVPSGARDLMFRDADRANFHATQPFLLTPSAPAKIRARESLQSQHRDSAFLLVKRAGQSR